MRILRTANLICDPNDFCFISKAVWITALAPYVVLFILLIRGISLPGAAEGIRYYLTPEWHKLANSKVSM